MLRMTWRATAASRDKERRFRVYKEAPSFHPDPRKQYLPGLTAAAAVAAVAPKRGAEGAPCVDGPSAVAASLLLCRALAAHVTRAAALQGRTLEHVSA